MDYYAWASKPMAYYTMLQTLEFGSVNSPHTLIGMWLLSHAGIRVNLYSKTEPHAISPFRIYLESANNGRVIYDHRCKTIVVVYSK